MRFCPNCGAQMDDAAKFCTQCGGKMPEVMPVAPAAPVQQAPAAPVYEAPAAPVQQAPAAPVYEAPAAPVQHNYQPPVQPPCAACCTCRRLCASCSTAQGSQENRRQEER